MAAQMTGEVQWPHDSRILSRLALMEVADLTGDRSELVTSWMVAAERRWQETAAASGRYAAA